jgi:hypothetical protein
VECKKAPVWTGEKVQVYGSRFRLSVVFWNSDARQRLIEIGDDVVILLMAERWIMPWYQAQSSGGRGGNKEVFSATAANLTPGPLSKYRCAMERGNWKYTGKSKTQGREGAIVLRRKKGVQRFVGGWMIAFITQA